MGYKLYINGSQVHTPPNQDLAGAFGVNSLQDLASRKGFASNQIGCPMTNPNKLIFGNAEQFLSASYVPYTPMSCYINDDSDNRVITGSAILMNVTTTYNIMVVGGNADWFTRAKELTLEDLIDLVGLNHFWKESEVIGNRANIWSDGFIYPNIDYGLWLNLATTSVPYYEFYAAVYQKYLFQKAFEELGFSINSEWFDTDTQFDPQIFPFAATWKRDKRYEHRSYTKLTSDGCVFTTGAGGGELVNVVLLDSSDYNHVILDGFTARWVILDPIRVTYRLTGTTTNFDAVTNEGRIRMHRYERNSTTATIPAAVDVVTFNVAPGTNPIDITFELDGEYIYMFQAFSPDSNNMNIDAGSIIEATGYEVYDVDNVLDYLRIISEDDCVFENTYNYIALSGTLPDVKVVDMIRAIVNKYYLIYDTDFFNEAVKIFTLQTVKNNINVNFDDWSDLLDESEEPEISFKPPGFFKRNILRYATDETDHILVAYPEYGQGEILIDNAQLDDEGVVFESVFAIVLRRPSFLNCTPDLHMAYIPKFIDGEDNECTPRMARVTFDGDYNLQIGSNPVEPTQPGVYFDEGYSFLIAEYFDVLVEIMAQFKMARQKFRLNTVHIGSLDFSKPVWVEKYGCWFYKSDIPEFLFTREASSIVEIVKL